MRVHRHGGLHLLTWMHLYGSGKLMLGIFLSTSPYSWRQNLSLKLSRKRREFLLLPSFQYWGHTLLFIQVTGLDPEWQTLYQLSLLTSSLNSFRGRRPNLLTLSITFTLDRPFCSGCSYMTLTSPHVASFLLCVLPTPIRFTFQMTVKTELSFLLHSHSGLYYYLLWDKTCLLD